MSYEKQTWKTGDTVTADKLNHMENGIEGAGGYEVTPSKELIFNQTVTSTYQGYNVCYFSYLPFIEEDFLIIEFDGVEYECEKIIVDKEYSAGHTFYGGATSEGVDLSICPFCFESMPSAPYNRAYVAEAGTYEFKVYKNSTDVIVSEDFERAVNVVTADDLNHIESEIDVLYDVIGIDTNVVFSDEVTTTEYTDGMGAKDLESLSGIVTTNYKRIIITFNGIQYICSWISPSSGSTKYLGGYDGSDFDFTNYPFAIMAYGDMSGFHNVLITENPTTCTLKMEVPGPKTSGVFMVTDESGTLSETWSTIDTIFNTNKTPIFIYKADAVGVSMRLVMEVYSNNGTYYIKVAYGGIGESVIIWTYTANNSNNYPVLYD